MTNLRKGDLVKVVVYEDGFGARIPEDQRKDTFTIDRRWTKAKSRWYNRNYHNYDVFVRIPIAEGTYINRIDVPVDHVIKVNSKLYEQKERLLKGEQNEI